MFRILLTLLFTCVLGWYAPLSRAEDRPASPTAEPSVDLADFQSEAFSRPPDLVQTQGEAEWQLWRFNKGSRSEGWHGRLYLGDREMSGQEPGEVLTCALGKFIWQGAYEQRVHLWDRSGWLPAEGGAVIVWPEAAELTDRPAQGKYEDAETLWLYWPTNPDSLPQGRYGALRHKGRWMFGRAVGERLKTSMTEYVWRGSLGDQGLNLGWLKADSDPDRVFDPSRRVAGKAPHMIKKSGRAEWRAWFTKLDYMCPVCSTILPYGELYLDGLTVSGHQRGEVSDNELGRFIWTPEEGWTPEDKTLYLVQDCGEQNTFMERECWVLPAGVNYFTGFEIR